MDKNKYIHQLHDEIRCLMERPVTLGRAEEIGAYAGTIRALHKLDAREGTEAHEGKEGFTKADAERWAEHMENADGTTGAHWTMEQTTAVADSIGVHAEPWIWFAALNMIYSDYWATAQKYGVDRPEFYADLAKEFLFDKDGGGPEAKLAGYYHGIVEPRPKALNTK